MTVLQFLAAWCALIVITGAFFTRAIQPSHMDRQIGGERGNNQPHNGLISPKRMQDHG